MKLFPFVIIALFTAAGVADMASGEFAKAIYYFLSAAINVVVLAM